MLSSRGVGEFGGERKGKFGDGEKWSLVEVKKGKTIGKHGRYLRGERVQSPETLIEEEEGFNSLKSLQDDLIGEPFYLWRKCKFWRWRRGAEN